jgi:hypothetical protein
MCLIDNQKNRFSLMIRLNFSLSIKLPFCTKKSGWNRPTANVLLSDQEEKRETRGKLEKTY